MSHELTKNQKNRHFEVLSSLVLCNSKEPCLNRMVTCDESGFCTMTDNAISAIGQRRSYKALPEAKLALKKRSSSLFAGLLLVWSTTAFWILARPLHLRSMLSKSVRHPWKLQRLRLALVNRKGLILPHDNVWPHVAQPTLQKLNKLGYKILLHPPYSLDFSPKN